MRFTGFDQLVLKGIVPPSYKQRPPPSWVRPTGPANNHFDPLRPTTGKMELNLACNPTWKGMRFTGFDQLVLKGIVPPSYKQRPPPSWVRPTGPANTHFHPLRPTTGKMELNLACNPTWKGMRFTGFDQLVLKGIVPPSYKQRPPPSWVRPTGPANTHFQWGSIWGSDRV